ncbi:MAG: hypothetical protein A2008_07865 [Candidatus Wallbacteria bacterium GWC2_49_35]|uniref:Uncharacterized protein n=1 Tax=Candidatus Wallbacteria bacterium GWC2_49_35 TaxID=1817813 RepID=A0A1F7WFD4_9BACT|nr:MAG: hypothetical protein A2008_07865 [Candidatus Wallbacteria bacterium GWC2_49_35]HBC76586.1 hypothetical protein [Candidatus Wallbacteria bacterium]
MGDKNGGGAYVDMYAEKYEKDSEDLLERLFKTDHIFKLDGFLLKRYVEVLRKVFGYDRLRELPQDRVYHIDKNGFSFEIADFLGNPNYLFMPPSTYFSVIVSPDQQDARLLDAPFSFLEECLAAVYKKYREIIKFITKDDAAVIQYKFNLRNFDDITRIHRLRSITMSIDTTDERVVDIARLQKSARGLAENDNLLSDAYIAEMMELVKKTGRGVKNILSKAYLDDITVALQSFYIQYPQTIISLFDAANKNTLLFYQHGEYTPPEDDTGGVYPVVIGAKNIIENLEALKFIDYHTNPAFIADKAELLEDIFLFEKGFDVNRLSKFEISRTKSGLASSMPEIINILHELKGVFEQPRVNAKKELAKLPVTAKFILAYAKSEFGIVNKLLCLFDRANFVRRYYSDIAGLERDITQMPPDKRYYVLKYLSREIRRSDVINE